ncbi:hypothetical protein GBA52_011552 [Prunus armeniaca]|nr:hypothetical protein GBA52_011552 [Prunus armeniaca]
MVKDNSGAIIAAYHSGFLVSQTFHTSFGTVSETSCGGTIAHPLKHRLWQNMNMCIHLNNDEGKVTRLTKESCLYTA